MNKRNDSENLQGIGCILIIVGIIGIGIFGISPGILILIGVILWLFS